MEERFRVQWEFIGAAAHAVGPEQSGLGKRGHENLLKTLGFSDAGFPLREVAEAFRPSNSED